MCILKFISLDRTFRNVGPWDTLEYPCWAGHGTDPILGYLVAMLGAPEGAIVACYTYHSIAMSEV